jgi:hypothetical protein
MPSEQAQQSRPQPVPRQAEAARGVRPSGLDTLAAQLNQSPRQRALAETRNALEGATVQRAEVVQRATTYAKQREIFDKATETVKWTSQQAIANITKRVSFNANPNPDLAHVANFATYGTTAKNALDHYANVFSFTAAQGYTNYNGTGLDNSTIPADHAVIKGVRDANTSGHVEDRKKAMIKAVAKPGLVDTALGYNSNALTKADTFGAAQNALAAWETHYFTLSRSQIIEAAKKRAKNGHTRNATVWEGTPKIGNFTTHMTVYNAQISRFGDTLVRANTDQAASNTLANHVLANGADDLGIHLTLETGNWPHVFGNPPDANRHYGTLPANVAWADFVGPLRTGQDAVRSDVWAYVNAKVAKRA